MSPRFGWRHAPIGTGRRWIRLAFATSVAVLPSVVTGQGGRSSDSAGVRIVVSSAGASVASPFHIDALPRFAFRASPPSRIVGVHRFADGRWLLADAGQFRMTYLSEDGRFLGHVGKRGRTEPDFDAIQAVIAGPLGEALVWDGASRRLSRLDASRRIRGSTRIDLPRDMPRDFVPRLQVAGRLEVGDLVVGISSTQIGGDSSGHYRYRTELMRYDRSGRIVAPIIMLEGGEYYVYRGGGPILSRDVPFAPQVRWTVGTESIFVTDGRTYSIKEYAPTGNLVRILRLDRQPTIVTPTMIAEYRTSALAAMDPRYRTALLKLLDALHYPERAAAYTSLQLDPEGNLWARHQSLGRGVESWDVFAPNGSLRGTVRMPEGTALVGVTENVVVTRRELSDTVVFGFHGKR